MKHQNKKKPIFKLGLRGVDTDLLDVTKVVYDGKKYTAILESTKSLRDPKVTW